MILQHFPAEASHLFAVKLCQILSTIQHLPADDPTGILPESAWFE